MHKLENSQITAGRSLFLWLLRPVIAISISLPACAAAFPQDKTVTQAPADGGILPEAIGGKWKAAGRQRTLGPEQWKILPGAEVMAEYGLQKIFTRSYTDGKSRLTVEALDLGFVAGAYGLLTYNRRSLPANRIESRFGQYLLSIYTDRPEARPDPQILAELENLIPQKEQGRLPVLPSNLPAANRIADSETYILGPAALLSLKGLPADQIKPIDFTGGTEIVAADYGGGGGKMTLLIVEYQTPQFASDGYARASAEFQALDQPEKQKRLLKRTGNYVVCAYNVANQAEAQDLIGRIKYTPRVYWEGSKVTDIPIQFRPADPAAIEEASQTAKILIRAFYWIGAMILAAVFLGVIAGGAFFYYRRYRRRKLGLDDLFSDAGETIRLNLDDFLLGTDFSKFKLLRGKRKEDTEQDQINKS